MPKSVLFNEQVPRLYYSIGEVCQRFAVSPSLLRFYESELGVPLHTKRTRNGKRLFTESNMELIETLVRLTVCRLAVVLMPPMCCYALVAVF